MSGFVLANKKIAVIGMGLTGLSCVRFLVAKGAEVIAMDSRQELPIHIEVPLFLGELDAKKLSQMDLIVVSPGVDLNAPALQKAMQKNIKVIGDIELFAQFNTRPVIAITGSNGKTTVTHLVTQMCAEPGKKVLMGGNVGVPALELLEQDADIIVLELSSFQLDTTFSLKSDVSTVLNLTEDHLDRHGSFTNYQQAKLKIYTHSKFAVVNRDDALVQPNNPIPAISFGLSASQDGFSWDNKEGCILLDGQPFLSQQDCLLDGAHNMLNIQASAALAMQVGIDKASVLKAAKAFGGLPHRCETVAVKNGIRWINDSKATNVGATLAAIKGLSGQCQGRLILIAGGEGKGADFSAMAECLNTEVALLITLGKDGDKIAALAANSIKVNSLLSAVQAAAKYVQSGDFVLLSPACASLDMFANYQVRGETFSNAVKEVLS